MPTVHVDDYSDTREERQSNTTQHNTKSGMFSKEKWAGTKWVLPNSTRGVVIDHSLYASIFFIKVRILLRLAASVCHLKQMNILCHKEVMLS